MRMVMTTDELTHERRGESRHDWRSWWNEL